MPRRSLLTLLVLASLVLVAVLLPRTPPGRTWLLERVRGAAATAGWTIDWRESAGNPWRELELRGLTVEGPGVDASFGRARLTWFAPALVTGDLPLWISVDDADVTIDAADLPSGDGGGGDLPIRPDLRELELRGVRVQVGDAPYTLPDLRFEDLAVSGRGSALTADGRLVSDEGALAFDADVDLDPFSLDAEVRDADVRIARAWWSGVTGGTASGTVGYRPGEGVVASLEVREGALRAGGVDVRDVEGPVEMQDGLVRGDLSGVALGGPVAATARVDVSNARWSGTLRATPDLAVAATWGAGDALPDRLRPEGTALVTASASGWRTVEVDGAVRAEGSVDGRPLTLTSDDVRYASGEGLSLSADGTALDGAVSLDATTGEDGTVWTVAADGASLGPARDLVGRLEATTAGGLRGSFDATGAIGEPSDPDAAPPLTLAVDGELDGGAVQAFVDGQLADGGRIEGAARLADGALQGAVRLADAGPLANQPVVAELSVDGPLDALPIELALTGDAPWAPTLPGVRVDADLRGSATAVLDGLVLRSVEGRFGPLAVSGELPLAAGASDEDTPGLAWSLDDTPLAAGPATARAAVTDGTFAPWRANGSRLTGEVTVREVVAPSASADTLTASLAADLPFLAASGTADPLQATARGPNLEARWSDGRLELSVAGQPVTVADTSGPLDLDASLRGDAPIASLRGSARLTAGEVSIDARATDQGIVAEALLPAGAALGGATLARDLQARLEVGIDLAGTLQLSAGEVDLTGQVAMLAGSGSPALGSEDEAADDVARDTSRFDGVLTTAGRTANVVAALAPWRVEADGELDVGALAALVDVPLTGTARLDGIVLSSDRAVGNAELSLSDPLDAEATWRDGAVTGRLPTPVGEVDLSGTLRPGATPVATATHAWGELAWDDGALRGAGALPATGWRAVETREVPWRLASGPAGDGATGPLALVRADVGDGSVVWEDGALTADVDLPILVAGRTARLSGGASFVPGGGGPTVDLRLDADGGTLTASGPWTDLAVAGDLDAATLADAAAAGVDPAGRVAFEGTADLPAGALALSGTWQAGDRTLELSARLDADGATASASGAGFDVDIGPGGISVEATNADPGPFLPVLAGTSLDGTLAASADGSDWRGELRVARADLGDATLVGNGERLEVVADAVLAEATLVARGTLLPAIDLTVEGRHDATGAVLDAAVRGALPSDGGPWPELSGTLTVPETVRAGYGLAASELVLGGTVLSPTVASASGGTLRLTDGILTGSVTLEGRVADVPHALEVRIDGPLSTPAGSVAVRGPLLDADGTLGGSGGTDGSGASGGWIVVEGEAGAGAWPAATGALAPGDAGFRFSAERDGSWSADVTASAAPGGRTLQAELSVSGRGAAGQGDWTLRSDDGRAMLAGEVDGSPDGATLIADVASLDADALAGWTDLDVRGNGDGVVTVDLGPGTVRTEADASFVGTVAGRPLTLEAAIGSSAGDRIRVASGEHETVADRDVGASAWTLGAAGPSYALTGELAADLTRATLDGTLADAPLELRAVRESGGSLLALASWSGAQADLGVRSADGGWIVTLDASAPARAELPAAGSLSARAELIGGEVRLARAELVVLEPRPLRADLDGVLFPSADLRGTVTGLLDAAEPDDVAAGAGGIVDTDAPSEVAGDPRAIGVTLRGSTDAWTVRTATPGLSLTLDGSGSSPTRATLSGAGRTLYGASIVPDAGGLRWDATDGWQGGARVALADLSGSADASPVSAAATLEGRGASLGLGIDADVDRAPATARLRLDASAQGAPWQATLEGSGSLRASLAATPLTTTPLTNGAAVDDASTDPSAATDAATADDPPPPALTLDAPLTLSGSVLAPRLDGTPTLGGATDARGRLGADPGGLELILDGEALDLDLALDADGWRVDAGATDLPLDAWLATLSEPRLDADAALAGGWGGDVRGRVGSWRVRADGGEASGTAEFSDGVSASARIDADLAAVIGPSASGRLTGPVSIDAPAGTPLLRARLSGALTAEEVRFGDARIDGELVIGGRLPVPDLRADLRLGGPVDGELELGWRPDDARIDLRADLVLGGDDGPVRIDLRASGPRGGLTASGEIDTPYGLLSVGADGDTLRLSGEGGLDGASLSVRPFPGDRQGASLILPLAALAGPATGVAELELTPGDTWLRGRIDGAGAAGATLPDLSVTGRDGRLAVAGDDANGSVDAELTLASLAWRVAARDLTLPGVSLLELDAAGQRTTGRGEATLAPTSGADRLALRAERTAEALEIALAGTIEGAPAEIDLRRDDGAGWSGPVRVEGLDTPAGALDLTGRAEGDGALPRLALEAALDGPVPTEGTLLLGAPGAASDAAPDTAPNAAPGELAGSVDLAATLPGGEDLVLVGDVWPTLDLRLSGDRDAGTSAARLRAPAWSGAESWRIEGATRLTVAGATVELFGSGDAGAPTVRVRPPGVRDSALVAALPARAPLDAIEEIASDGVTARGEGRLSGEIAWRPALDADLRDLSWASPYGDVRLDGTVRDGVADLAGRFVPVAPPVDQGVDPDGEEAVGEGTVVDALLRDLVGPGPLPFSLRGGRNGATLAFGADDDGPSGVRPSGVLSFDGATGEAHLELVSGPVRAEGSLAPGTGLQGRIDLDELAFALPGGVTARIDGEAVADGASLSGTATVRGPGRVTIDGQGDIGRWLPAAYLPEGAGDASAMSELSLRLADLEASAIPGLAEAVPRLTGGVSAVVEVRGTRVLAQVAAPELQTAGRAVPLRLEGAGDFGVGRGGLSFGGSWAGSPLQGTIGREALDLLWTLERFPIQAPIEARFGALDVDAEATGVLRLDMPWNDPAAASVRIATELVRLERGGVVTTGTFAAEGDANGVEVRADFAGDGRWQAEGSLARDDLDFEFRADDADATPLLGLVPSLARLGAGARGDLVITARGDVRSPRIEASTPGLELELAGARYRLTDSRATLDGTALRLDAALDGVAPVGGRLIVAGDGRLRLEPWRLEDAGIELAGDLVVPVIGEVSDVEGTVTADDEGRPRLDVLARLGAPLELSGTLWPLDLAVRGEGLAVRAPGFLLDSSVTDADLRLRYEDLFRISGSLAVAEGRFVLGIRPRPASGDAPGGGSGAGTDGRARNPALSRVSFENLTLVGRRLAFNESFGSAEFDANLRLGGTAAEPRLSGSANAQRGTFRFSGRDFQVREGVATFEPSRGAYPALEVEAVATFEKRDVLAGAVSGLRFDQPPGGTFDVLLSFEAEVLPTPGEARPFRLDLDPVLTSNALISVPAGEGLSAGTRALTEPELLSLVTLGRLDLAGELANGGVAGGVARSALDSAVDLLILSELQDALSEALGVDLVEIRTSTLSSVLAGDDDPFGVSLRLGGYVGEGLFASFELGRFADGDAGDALSNTLALTYELGPVAFDLSTRLGFAQGTDLAPVPTMSAALRYQLTPYLAVETGASLSTPQSEARFGVTLRW